jgi:RNA polymerase sigma-70 factor (ECF subfamily)
MSESDQTEFFVQQIAEHQNRLFGYVFSMLGDHARASDVLQETNLVLWRKQSEFRTGEPFLPWAFAIARFQVLAHVRDRGRDRCLLDPDLVESLTQETQQQVERLETVRHSLQQCLGQLTPTNRDLIQRRYYRSASIQEIAQSLDRGVSSVKVALLRIRRKLADCVRQQTEAYES